MLAERFAPAWLTVERLRISLDNKGSRSSADQRSPPYQIGVR